MNYKDINDYELLFMVKEHDEEALNVLYTKYYSLIRSLINKYKKTANNVSLDINDLNQEALIVFYDAINKYNDNYSIPFTNFLALLITRRFNKVIRNNNTNKQKVMNNFISIEDLEISLKDEKNNPENYYKNKEFHNKLLMNINDKFSKEDYKIIELLIKGFTIKEIAIKFNKSYSCIYNKIVRIRKRINLKEYL